MRSIHPAFIAAVLTAALTAGPGWSDDQQQMTRLWHDAPPPAPEQPLPPKKPWVTREREIAFDPAVIAVLKDATARPHSPIGIELFDGQAYELDIISTVARLSDITTIRGTLKSTARSPWSLVITGSLLNGTIQVGERLYKVEHVQNGRHRLLEVDPIKLPPD